MFLYKVLLTALRENKVMSRRSNKQIENFKEIKEKSLNSLLPSFPEMPHCSFVGRK